MEDFLAEFCTNRDSFDAAYAAFQSAEEGSEEESAAVDQMAQVGTDMEALVGEDLPQLVTALTVIQTAAADYVVGGAADRHRAGYIPVCGPRRDPPLR